LYSKFVEGARLMNISNCKPLILRGAPRIGANGAGTDTAKSRGVLIEAYPGEAKVMRSQGHVLVDEEDLARTANLADPGIRQDFPSLRLIDLLGGKIAHCRLIPADSSTFESEALHACELLLKHDGRFGRVPQSRLTRPAKLRRK
jgi:hypothetical protein